MLMAEAIPREASDLGRDKNYDTQEFVRELRGMNITRMWRRTIRTAGARWISEPRGISGMR